MVIVFMELKKLVGKRSVFWHEKMNKQFTLFVGNLGKLYRKSKILFLRNNAFTFAKSIRIMTV